MSAADTAAPPDFYLVTRRRNQLCIELQIQPEHQGFKVGQAVQFRDEAGDWITAEVRAFSCLAGWESAAMVQQTGTRTRQVYVVPLGRLVAPGGRQ